MTPAMILAALDAALKVIQFIAAAKEQAARTGEWTAEEEAAVDARLAAAFASTHWQPKP